MAPDGVGAILNGDVKSLEQLEILAPDVTNWLVESLGRAHEDQALKRRLKDLLGNQFYVSNLKHFGLWDELQQKCSAQALEMGEEMKAYFEEHRLGEVLGVAYPNVAGRVGPRRCVACMFYCKGSLLPTIVCIPTASLHVVLPCPCVATREPRWQHSNATKANARRGWTTYCRFHSSRTQARVNCGTKCRSFIFCG